MEQGYPLKKFYLDKLKSTVSISNCKKTVFNYVFAKGHEKHLVIEWLSRQQNKRYLINFTFYETFRDEPVPHENFTFLHQGSHEIPGGGRPDSPPLVSDVGRKPLGIRRVNKCTFHFCK